MIRFAGRAALAAATLLVLQAQVCHPTPPPPPPAPLTVTGTLRCNGVPAAHMPVIPNGGVRVMTDGTGAFSTRGVFAGTPNGLRVLYEGSVEVAPGFEVPMKIGDDAMVARHDDLAATPAVTGDVVAFGTLDIPGTDCLLWANGVASLRRYFELVALPPPGSGGLHFMRWSNVPLSVGAPHTLFDLIVVPTDATAAQPSSVFHEFGHRIRHAADGDRTHWDGDDVLFRYARKHGGAEITNRGYTFNEGWANYWELAFAGNTPSQPCADGLPADPGFTDFNETNVGQRLLALSCPVGHPFMIRILLDNPGVIHTLPQFEQRYCAAVGTNPFCAGGVPVRTFPPCPPGWNDDGITCRFITDFPKHSFYRGPGQPAPLGGSCAPGTEQWLLTCYPVCPAPFVAAGINCVQPCPAGFNDVLATCHREPLSDPLQNIFSDE